MSAFEVAVTPTRIKNARKINAAREPTDVYMAPFSAKAIVLFEDVPITKTARRYLNIYNPTDDILETQITKTISEHLNVQIEWITSSIPARGMIGMEVIWSPVDVITAKETLQITDDRNFHKDIKFIFKSIDKSRPTTTIKSNVKLPRLSSASVGGFGARSSSSLNNTHKPQGVYLVPKKPLKKSPANHLRKKSQENVPASRILSSNTSNVFTKVSRTMVDSKIIETSFTSTTEVVKTDLDGSLSDIFCFTAKSPKNPKRFANKTNKENVSQQINGTNIFDKINFSPSSTISFNNKTPTQQSVDFFNLSTNYLASLPTPTLSSLSSAMSQNKTEYSNQLKSCFDQQFYNQQNNPETPKRKPRNYSQKNDNSIITSLAMEITPCIQATDTKINNSFEISPQIFNSSSQCRQITSSTETSTENVNKSRNCHAIPNKTFELPKRLSLSPPTIRSPLSILNNSIENRCNLSIPPLSMILEDDGIDEDNIRRISQKTFNISQPNSKETINLNSTNSLTTKSPQPPTVDQPLIGTPLRKKFQSMRELNKSIAGQQKTLKTNQGSMPNLNDIAMPFENNRYFYQSNDKYDIDEQENPLNLSISSIISTKSVQFRENEILAHSSEFNLHNCPSSSSEQNEKQLFRNKMAKILTSTATKSRLNDEKFAIPKCTIRKLQPSLTVPSIMVTPSSPRKQSASSSSTPLPSPSNNQNSCIKRLNEDSLQKISQKSSPPKRYRPSISSTSQSSSFTVGNSKGQTMYIQNWRAVKPKKINYTKPLLQLKQQKDERVILFDAEMHIQGVINPDPFAASTTIDPFLAATMYLEEQHIDKHETHFKKWLNVLVTIPDDLDSANTNVKVDYGRIFNDVRNKDVSLAESKETISSNYFTKYRLEGLRRAAVKLYVSDEMRIPLQKLLVQIERKLILIRVDRDLHRNFVLQQEILELLLCINPLWLRLGLEVVFGEQIKMETNSDVISLSTFILNRVFKDKYIEMKHNRMYAQSTEYAEHIRKFTLKKILMLLYFLDLAKNKKIIHHNPCLFVKTSEIKETKQILLKFSSRMLAKVGDIQRDLRRIGIVLTHKQTYLDEFDYAFRNLAVDLRDGVRLSKVMEIILMRDNLHGLLWVPAISRLQRVHNVDLSLKALAEAEFHIVGSITAADIADGHREKTLSLLWQIIYKFRAPKFNVAATIIQTWWRKSWLQVCVRRRIEQKLLQRRIRAAVCIQSAYRAYICRKYYSEYREERLRAVQCLQRCTRTFIAVRKFKKTIISIKIIQRWFRNISFTRKIRKEYLRLHEATIRIQRRYRTIILAKKLEASAKCIRDIKETAFKEHKASIMIQQRFRAWQLMKKQQHQFHVIQTAVIKIQRYYRSIICMRRERRNFIQLKTTTLLIQRKFRAQLILRKEFSNFIVLRKATKTIQSHFRAILLMRIIRVEYLLIKKTTIIIQQRYRANLLMKKQHSQFIAQKQATVRIQQQYRAQKLARIHRLEFITLRKVTISIQRRFRAQLLMKRDQTAFKMLKSACLTIQQYFRSNQLAKNQRQQLLNLKSATRTIQEWYRATKLMHLQVDSYKALRKSTIFIQQRFRANKLQVKDQNRYKTLKMSIIIIQRQFHARKLMKIESQKYKLLRNRVICIQNYYRAYRQMKFDVTRYQQIRAATRCIQQHLRAQLLMKKQRDQYLLLLRKTIFIQRLYRANRCTTAERNNYEQIKQSVTIIQQYFRNYLQMKKQRSEYQHLRVSTIRIQTYFRSYLLMKSTQDNYQTLRIHVQFIQLKFKANLLMKKQRSEYNLLRLVVIMCQRKYRAKILMKNTENQYKTLKSATICIQQHFRAQQKMICDRNEYTKTREIIINIQQQFRANILMKNQQNYYQKLKKSVLICQRQFRANNLARTNQTEYKKFKSSVICVQRKFRANLLMKSERAKYEKLRSTIIFCQTRFRANVQMMNDRCSFLCLRAAIIQIQRQYRAQLEARKQKLQFHKLKSKVIVIQRLYRARLMARNQRAKYLNLQSTALLIQRKFRAQKAMKMELKTYTELRKYCLIIQQRWRAKLLTVKYRQDFNRLKSAVILIQQRFRALLLMKQELTKYKAIRSCTVFIQRLFLANLAMKKERKNYVQLRSATILMQQRYRAHVIMVEERKNHKTLKMATVFIQRKFRAKLLARKVRFAFALLKGATQKLQNRFRANKQMQQYRFIFLQLKSNTIRIQQRFRANQMLTKCRQEFQRKKSAIILIQRKFRGYLLMKRDRQIYEEKIMKIKVIQKYFRSYLQMKHDRNDYQKLQWAVVKIQQRYRATQLAKNVSNQFKLIKTMAIYIQRKFRAYKAMQYQRIRFLQLRLVCVHVQQKYRGHKRMLVDREQFLKTRSMILALQSHVRGYLARRAYLAKFTPEMIETKRQQKAARVIQTAWRAHFVRKKCTKKVTQIRNNIKTINKNVKPENTLKNRIIYSIRILRGRYNMVDQLRILEELVKISREVPQTLEEYAIVIANFCYGIMSQAIRSEPDKQLIELCSYVILNLARYLPTKRNSYQKHGLVTVAQMLLRWCDKDCHIFNTLCTAIWLFSKCPEMKSQIRQYMTTYEAEFMLVETKKMVIRKEKMRNNRWQNPKLIPTPQQKRLLPMVLPDFGMKGKNEPYIFYCSIFAFDTVLRCLDIKLLS